MPHCVPAAFAAALFLTPSWTRAQELKARDFMIPDADVMCSVDLAKARELGVWDELEASVLGAAFARIEKEAGFPLAALDRFHVSAAVLEGGPAAGGHQVLAWEGNRALAVHDRYSGPGWTEERIGSFDVLRTETSRGGDLFAVLRPELHVYGSAAAVQPVLEGKKKAGPPSPDLQSLLSGREGRIAWIVIALDDPSMQQRFLGQVLGAETTAWPEGDLPTHLSAQALASGDPDDPQLQVRVVLRHRTDGEGVKASVKALDACIGNLRKEPRMRLAQPILKKAVAAHDRTDAIVQIDLGRSRDAVGHIAALLLPVIGRPDEGPGEVRAVPAGDGK